MSPKKGRFDVCGLSFHLDQKKTCTYQVPSLFNFCSSLFQQGWQSWNIYRQLLLFLGTFQSKQISEKHVCTTTKVWCSSDVSDSGCWVNGHAGCLDKLFGWGIKLRMQSFCTWPAAEMMTEMIAFVSSFVPKFRDPRHFMGQTSKCDLGFSVFFRVVIYQYFFVGSFWLSTLQCFFFFKTRVRSRRPTTTENQTSIFSQKSTVGFQVVELQSSP